MSRIFISHASADNTAALALSAWLDENGWSDHFLDIDTVRGLVPGDRWMKALANAVDRCEAVLFLASPSWRASKFCFAEFFEAKKLGKRIFGVVIEPIALTDLPDQLTSEWQVCDLTTEGEDTLLTVERAPLVSKATVRFNKHALQELARGLRRAGLDASTFTWPPSDDAERPPYPGLRALDEPDAAVFFGREASIVNAIDQLRAMRGRNLERLYIVLGASGAGKSSFLRAGLLPRLKRDTANFFVLPYLRPERAAIGGTLGLLSALKAGFSNLGLHYNQAELRESLYKTGLYQLFRQMAAELRRQQQANGARGGNSTAEPTPTIVLPVEQAEELFQADGRQEASQFLELMSQFQSADAAGRSRADAPRVLFIFTLRTDSFEQVQSSEVLQAATPVLCSLPPMPTAHFKAVIEGPAARHSASVKSVSIAPELVEALMLDAQGADALPLLALTLEWLWREFDRPGAVRIGLAQYESIGRVRGVINRAVQQALARPEAEPAIPASNELQQVVFAQVFPALATVDPDTGHAKRRLALRATIRAAGQHADALVSRLIEQRLLSSDLRRMTEKDATAVEVVEVAHEALLRQWDSLERWLHEFSNQLALIEAVRRATQDWLREKRHVDLTVHTASRLGDALALMSDPQLRGRFNADDIAYLQACQEQDNIEATEKAEQALAVVHQQAARARWQTLATWGLSIAGIVTVALILWVLQQSRDLARQTSQVLADASKAAADKGHVEQALRLSILANRQSWLRAVDDSALPALLRASAEVQAQLVLEGQVLALSPDERLVLTRLDPNTLQVWEIATGAPFGGPLRHDNAWSKAIFSTDNQSILTADGDTIRLWDVRSGQVRFKPVKMSSTINTLAFAVQGSRIVAASKTEIQILDVATGAPLGLAIKIAEASLNPPAISDDGTRLLVEIDELGLTRLWDIKSGTAVGRDFEISWDPPEFRGKRIVWFDSEEYEVRDAVSGEVIVRRSLPGLDELRVSPDGKAGLARQGSRIQILDLDSGKRLGDVIESNENETFTDVKFSANSNYLIAISKVGFVRLWEVKSGKLVDQFENGEKISSFGFNRDGTRLFFVWDNTHVVIADPSTMSPIGDAWQPHEPIKSARFANDGKSMVVETASTVQVLEVVANDGLSSTFRHQSSLAGYLTTNSAAMVLTSGDDNLTRVWARGGTRYATTALRQSARVSSFFFSPNGKYMIVAFDDYRVRAWNVDTGAPIGEKTVTKLPTIHDFSSADEIHLSAGASSSGNNIRWNLRTDSEQGIQGAGSTNWSYQPDNQRMAVKNFLGISVRPLNGRTDKHALELEDSKDVDAFKFSGDGQYLLGRTGSLNPKMQIWSMRTGKEIGPPILPSQPVKGFSLSRDGSRLLVISDGGKMQLWDPRTGKQIESSLRDAAHVTSAILSPTGNRIVSQQSGQIRLWDTKSGEPVGKPIEHKLPISDLSFSPDGSHLAVASSQHGLQLISTADGFSIAASIDVGATIELAQFSENGKGIFIATSDHSLRRWDLLKKAWSGKPLLHETRVVRIITTPDGESLATLTESGTVKLASVGARTNLTPITNHVAAIQSITAGDKGRLFAVESTGSAVQVWTERFSAQPMIFSHDLPIRYSAFDASAKTITVATGNADEVSRISVWETSSGLLKGSFAVPESTTRILDMSSTGKLLLAAGDGDVKVFALEGAGTISVKSSLEMLLAHRGEFSPDNKYALYESFVDLILIDVASGRQVGETIKSEYSAGLKVDRRFAYDGQSFIVPMDAIVDVRKTLDGRRRYDPIVHGESVRHFAITSDSQTLLTVSKGSARLWKIANGQPIGEAMKHSVEILDAGLAASGRLFFTRSLDKSVRVWDSKNGKQVGSVIYADATIVAFNSAETHILAVSDKIISVYDIMTGHVVEVSSPLSAARTIDSAVFTKDGKRIVLTDASFGAHVWDLKALDTQSPSSRVQSICAQLHPSLRRVRSADIVRAPWIGRGAEGRDVCEGVAGRSESLGK